MFTLLSYPFTLVWRWVRIGDPFKKAQVKRVVVLGFDGMDPGYALRLIREGRLPNLRALAEKGCFRPLQTALPSISPVAWSTFTTGVDASRHNIYDFLTRDPCTYQPMLSSTDIRQATRVANIGRYVIPLEKPSIKLLQKSQAFWKLLGDRHISSIIQRVPITFPPVPFRGMLLSGMCVPDLRGTQGTFSFFHSLEEGAPGSLTGGERSLLRKGKGGSWRSRIVGPDDSTVKNGPRMTLPFSLDVLPGSTGARIAIDGCDPFDLPLRSLSPWIRLTFKAGIGLSVHGIARFWLNTVDPGVELYMTPIHIDPENPAMPISHPDVYAVYLAKRQGPFATLGLAEDTWALNERVIDEDAFLAQTMAFCDEREAMFLDALRHTRTGMVTTVFDTTDRVQHMFYRFLDPSHPANAGKPPVEERHRDAIARTYERMDALVGKVLPEVDRPDTLFLVVSDHGFTNFRRGVDINAWLRDHGYLALKEGGRTSGEWFEHVDWSRTRAFALGLTGLFVNRKGRERDGIVEEGAEYRALVEEIRRGLEALVDPATGNRCIRRAFLVADALDGPYRFDAPDVLVGYEGGYRHSWECATGRVTEDIFIDNVKSWSGDHCVDPTVVPGVIFSNRALATEEPRLIDVPFTILRMFGVEPPKYMQGRMILPEPGAAGAVRGVFEPSRLDASGAAPLFRVEAAGPEIADARAQARA